MKTCNSVGGGGWGGCYNLQSDCSEPGQTRGFQFLVNRGKNVLEDRVYVN